MTLPPKPSDISSREFWSTRYRKGEDGWEKGVAAPPLLRLARRLPPGRVAVPGCGRGHEVLALAALGWEAVGFDFAPEAIRAARRLARGAQGKPRFEQADLFRLPARHRGAFDAVLEHTCFCAVDPSRREEYVAAVRGLLKPGGLLLGLFYAHGRPGGPPFSVTPGEIRRLFSADFHIPRFSTPRDSFPSRRGLERLAILRRKIRRN